VAVARKALVPVLVWTDIETMHITQAEKRDRDAKEAVGK
jgi:hypothetical protein